MILVWNDTKAFQQHLEDMRTFRRAHHGMPGKELMLFKSMPTPYDINYPSDNGGARRLIETGYKTIIVPIWKIVPARGSQN